MASKWLLFVVFSTYLIHEAWTLPFFNSTAVIQPFVLSNQEVTMQYFVFGASEYAIWLILMAVIYHLFTAAREVMIWFVIFQALELLEYFISYNEPWGFIPLPGKDLGINITNIKMVVMFVVVTKHILWNPGK